MRVDKFLNTVNILKRRCIAQDMCETGVVFINGSVAKSSKNLRIGDVITLKYLEKTKQYKVLEIPTTKSIPKSQSEKYAIEL